MPTARERASDALLRWGTDLAIDRRDMERRLAAVPPTAPGYDAAVHAARMARWVDSTIRWLSWRLRPRTMSRGR